MTLGKLREALNYIVQSSQQNEQRLLLVRQGCQPKSGAKDQCFMCVIVRPIAMGQDTIGDVSTKPMANGLHVCLMEPCAARISLSIAFAVQGDAAGLR